MSNRVKISEVAGNNNLDWLQDFRKQSEQQKSASRVKEKNYKEILKQVQQDLNDFLNKT